MKLIIQIPCYNEAETLPVTLAELPREIAGIDQIEILIIDDGSHDRTSEVARQHGVHHIVRHTRNRGLAAAFQSGITACLQLGADIIVNTDADNQYPGGFIPALVQPIVSGQADLVIGDRQTHTIQHFSPLKRLLQHWGSAVVRWVSQSDVPDAPSGFRAMSRHAALQLNVFTRYTYTLETIIQASKRNLVITHVPVRTNEKLRDSRLIKSTRSYVWRSARTILYLFLLYQPLRSFSLLALPFFTIGLITWLRYGVILLQGEAERGSNVQSVIVGGVFILIAFLLVVLGALGEVIALNRRLQEDILFYLKDDLFRRSSLRTLDRPDSQPQQQLDDDPQKPMRDRQS
jgi:glycosyltransferase involved in cell wall biosynthesis